MSLRVKIHNNWIDIECITSVFKDFSKYNTFFAYVQIERNRGIYLTLHDCVELLVEPMPELVNINNTLFSFTKGNSYTNYMWFKPIRSINISGEDLYCLIIDDNSFPIILPSQLLSHYFKVKDI